MANVPVITIGGQDYNVKDAEIRNEFDHINNLVTSLTSKYFIDYRDGTVAPYNDNSFKVTNYIQVVPGMKISISDYRNPGYDADYAGMAFYNAAGQFVSGIQYTPPYDPILTTVPQNAVQLRATWFSDAGDNLKIFSSNYSADKIALRCGLNQVINSTPSAPYNNATTIPVGTIITYIGYQNFPSGLPEGITENVITIITENYRTAVRGGAVQKLYGVASSYFRYADNENAYGAWNRRGLESNVAVWNSSLFVSPWNDCNTIPIGTIVTYIGNEYIPAHAPDGIDGISTVVTLNYHQSSLGGSIQFITDKNGSWLRYATTEENYNSWVSIQSEKQAIHSESAFSLFETIGVIGDSYASGALTLTSSSGSDHYAISWPQIVARKNGITATNFSKGGLTTKTWLTDGKGLTLLNSESAKDLYICALGINDNAIGGISYLGTVSDIQSQADTFYGNYGKIINAIISKAPNAKIVMSTMAPTAPGSYVSEYNAAIMSIASYFSIPCMIQGEDPFFTSSQYIDNIKYNHPTAGGYAHMANAFDRMLCKVMDKNVNYFENVGINKS